MRKTWKREFSVGLLIFLCYLAYQGQVKELEVLVWPFIIFAGASFGQQWACTQGKELFERKVD